MSTMEQKPASVGAEAAAGSNSKEQHHVRDSQQHFAVHTEQKEGGLARSMSSPVVLNNRVLLKPGRPTPLGLTPGSLPVPGGLSRREVNAQANALEQHRLAASTMDQRLRAARAKRLNERTVRRVEEEAMLRRHDRQIALQQPRLSSAPSSNEAGATQTQSLSSPSVRSVKGVRIPPPHETHMPLHHRPSSVSRSPERAPYTVAIELGLLNRRPATRQHQFADFQPLGRDLSEARRLRAHLDAAAEDERDGVELARYVAMRRRHKVEEGSARVRQANEALRARQLTAHIRGNLTPGKK